MFGATPARPALELNPSQPAQTPPTGHLGWEVEPPTTKAMAAVEAFARQATKGTLSLELDGAMEAAAARAQILNRWPGASVSVDGGSLQITLEAPVRIAADQAHLADKYPLLTGTDRGRYVGTSRGRAYDLPRRVDPQLDGTKLAAHHPRVFGALADVKPGSMPFEAFLEAIEASIPLEVRKTIAALIDDAIRLGDEKQTTPPVAAPFPLEDRDKIRHALNYSWVHSRDMAVILDALGYPLESTGRHDIVELATGAEVKATLDKATPKAQWFKDYVATLKADEPVNIGFFNPHTIASIWSWSPDRPIENQEAMDMHRLSDHHDGSDPVEGAVNNVFHQREAAFGVRKKPSADWLDIGEKLATDVEAFELIKTDVGVPVARDAAIVMKRLEEELKITPWHLVAPT